MSRVVQNRGREQLDQPAQNGVLKDRWRDACVRMRSWTDTCRRTWPLPLLKLVPILAFVLCVASITIFTAVKHKWFVNMDGIHKHDWSQRILYGITASTGTAYGDFIPEKPVAKGIMSALMMFGLFSYSFVNELINSSCSYFERYIGKWIGRFLWPGAVLTMGVLFSKYYEGKSTADAVYLTFASATTIGYGTDRFQTNLGRICAAIWLPLTVSFVNRLGTMAGRSYSKWLRGQPAPSADAPNLTAARAALAAAEAEVKKAANSINLLVDEARAACQKAIDAQKSATETMNAVLQVENRLTISTDAIINAAKKVVEDVELAAKEATSVATEAANGVSKAVVDTAIELAKLAKVAVADSGKQVKTTTSAVKEIESVEAAIVAAKDVVKSAAETSKKSVQAAVDAVEKVKDATTSVQTAVNAVERSTTTSVQAATDAVKKVTDATTSTSVQAAVNAVERSRTTSVQAAVNAVEKVTKAQADAAKAVLAAKRHIEKSAYDTIGDAIKAAKNAVGTAEGAAKSAEKAAKSVEESMKILAEKSKQAKKDITAASEAAAKAKDDSNKAATAARTAANEVGKALEDVEKVENNEIEEVGSSVLKSRSDAKASEEKATAASSAVEEIKKAAVSIKEVMADVQKKIEDAMAAVGGKQVADRNSGAAAV